MTGIRHTDVRGISSGNPVCPPPVTCGDGPVGACGSASLRRHLHCFGSLPETSLTLRCGPEGPSRNPVCPPPVTCGDGPVGACGSASLRRHLLCFGSYAGTSLTLRCGPEGPSHLNPQSLRDSPLLRGAPLPPRISGSVSNSVSES